MADADYELDLAAELSPPSTRTGMKRLAAVAIAVGAAIAIIYGETWAIERAPTSVVACGFAKTADLRRALDNVLSAQDGPSSTNAF